MSANAKIAHGCDLESVVMDVDSAIRSLCALKEQPLSDGGSEWRFAYGALERSPYGL